MQSCMFHWRKSWLKNKHHQVRSTTVMADYCILINISGGYVFEYGYGQSTFVGWLKRKVGLMCMWTWAYGTCIYCEFYTRVIDHDREWHNPEILVMERRLPTGIYTQLCQYLPEPSSWRKLDDSRFLGLARCNPGPYIVSVDLSAAVVHTYMYPRAS